MKTVHYPDTWLRLVGIPFLAVFFWQFRSIKFFAGSLNLWQYYWDLGVNLFIVLVTWEANRYVIRLLDKRYTWIDQWPERLLIQLSLVIGGTSVMVISIDYLYQEVLLSHPDYFPFSWWVSYDLYLTTILVVLLNLLYTGIYLAQYHQVVVDRLTQERNEAVRMIDNLELDRLYNENSEQRLNQYQKHLLANYGPASILVATDKIAYIYRENEVCFLKTFDSKEYTSGSSLENLESLLSPVAFFRVNSQLLAHSQSIKHFRQHINGKLSVEFAPCFKQDVFVSKNKAPEFKEWLGKKI